MLSYELLAATDPAEAADWARRLGQLNRRRQRLTDEAVESALAQLAEEESTGDLLFVSDASYLPGIVGLGRRPADRSLLSAQHRGRDRRAA